MSRRWDDDQDRLPLGMQRVGYDADTQKYTYRDRDGSLWETASGSAYGRLIRANTTTWTGGPLLPSSPTSPSTSVAHNPFKSATMSRSSTYPAARSFSGILAADPDPAAVASSTPTSPTSTTSPLSAGERRDSDVTATTASKSSAASKRSWTRRVSGVFVAPILALKAKLRKRSNGYDEDDISDEDAPMKKEWD